MKLHRAVVARGYSFLTDSETLTESDLEKPIYLTISEHIELRNAEGDFEDFVSGQGLNIDLSLDEARAIIKALEKGIAEFESVDMSKLVRN